MVGGSVKVNEPLRDHTTLQIGGPVDVMVFPARPDDLVRVVRWCLDRRVPYSFLGFGSNVLAPDEGLEGVLLRTKPALDFIRFEGTRVVVGTGASVARLVAQAAARGLEGVEGLAGVPGSVGGALVMNAGTRMGEIGRSVVWVDLIDEAGRTRRLEAPELEYAYRSSRLQREPRWLVLQAELRLVPGDPSAIRRRVDEALQYRNRTQPLHLPSAGSVFKNPPGHAAGRLIEEAGCKGLRRGGAQVSEQHANWIVNTGGATAEDVLGLMIEARRRWLRRSGIAREPAIRLLGPLRERWRRATAATA
ncbi:MAG: UDP-N-acetylenolpyruvoylglucosamine reductase [Bacillota bacterium]|nr:MAG: UDP-N-acetylenolpyruvoylglucosamine reductase [Bacillota bacterium]